jgi:hypothetical protein
VREASRRRLVPGVSRREMIFDQAAFVHLLDEVVDGGALGPASS